MAIDIPTAATPPDQAEPTDLAPDSGPMVLATIMDNGDGTYQLVKGDEDEAMHEGPEGAEKAGSAGQTYQSPGELLKAVLDCIKEASGSTDGYAQDNFEAGFTGKEPKAPMAKPTPMMAKA